MMSKAEEMLISCLSPSLASCWRGQAFPSRPSRVTSGLLGKAYAAASQAVAPLDNMAVLQAYKANLLKNLDTDKGLDIEVVKEHCWARYLSICATKQMACTIGYSMHAMVAKKRHLWLNLSGNKEKEKVFLLDTQILPLGLFGDAVNAVVDRFQEAKSQSAAFRQFIPHHFQELVASTSQSQPDPSSHR